MSLIAVRDAHGRITARTGTRLRSKRRRGATTRLQNKDISLPLLFDFHIQNYFALFRANVYRFNQRKKSFLFRWKN